MVRYVHLNLEYPFGSRSLHGAGPSLALLAVRNHDHLKLDDFASLVLYLRTCVDVRPLPLAQERKNRKGTSVQSAWVCVFLYWVESFS